jgi:HK97 family phage major capsid protein
MSDQNAAAVVEAPPANDRASTLERFNKAIDSMEAVPAQIQAINDRLEKAEKVQYPFGGVPNGAPGIRVGEDPLTSRAFSMARVAVALAKRADQHQDWADYAKPEIDLSTRLDKAYSDAGISRPVNSRGFCIPLSSDLIPTTDREVIDQTGKTSKLPGIPVQLVKECRDMTSYTGQNGDHADELNWIARRVGSERLEKTLSASISTAGGALVAFPGQGELIELLRPREIFTRAGAQEIDLPPQGAIRFPRVTQATTIAAYAEGQTVSSSTPQTAFLLLQAKAYSGLVDIPEELIKFATSVAVEAWLRMEFTLDMAKKTDRDQVNGGGGDAITGVINYANVNLVAADTLATNGDTFSPEDPARVFAAVADQNAPVDRGFFYAMTNTLWGGLITRKDTYGRFMFNVSANTVGGGKVDMGLNGWPVFGSTNIPITRSKGSATNLTIVIAGVGPEWIIGRAGIIDLVVTNSDSTKFQQRISTMRGTQYIDAGPRHEMSFAYTDTLLNS